MLPDNLEAEHMHQRELKFQDAQQERFVLNIVFLRRNGFARALCPMKYY